MPNLFRHPTGQGVTVDHYANGMPKQVRHDVQEIDFCLHIPQRMCNKVTGEPKILSAFAADEKEIAGDF